MLPVDGHRADGRGGYVLHQSEPSCRWSAPGDCQSRGRPRCEPDLAESWDTSSDLNTWTFHLRHGVQCNNGYGELTSDDVVFSLKRAADSKSSAYSSDFAGVDSFDAIVNAPQAALLAVGRIAERPWVVGGELVVRPVLTLTVSFDHRVVDGARGAEFLDALASLVDEPARLVE